MRKFLFVAVLGAAAVGLMLAAPSTSQAQSCGYGSSYGGGYAPGYNGYYDRGYAPGYGGSYGQAYAPSYGGFYGRRPVIDHPTFGHWTPGRGYHEHGHLHVPHRGHYHTRPY